MLQAIFCPFVVSSIPLIRSGAVSNRTGTSAEKVMNQLFKENRLAKGTFIGLGRKLNLHNITCPVRSRRRGAGALVEFRSVVDAVRCAIEVQNGMDAPPSTHTAPVCTCMLRSKKWSWLKPRNICAEGPRKSVTRAARRSARSFRKQYS